MRATQTGKPTLALSFPFLLHGKERASAGDSFLGEPLRWEKKSWQPPPALPFLHEQLALERSPGTGSFFPREPLAREMKSGGVLSHASLLPAHAGKKDPAGRFFMLLIITPRSSWNPCHPTQDESPVAASYQPPCGYFFFFFKWFLNAIVRLIFIYLRLHCAFFLKCNGGT